ncbi:MAG: hypothetical protein V4696_00755 [Pseudomonadota bacterium]
MTKLTNPLPLFLDGRGALLDAGYIFVGDTGSDPEIAANQVPLFWDAALTIPAVQPLRTLGGVIMNGENPSFVFLAETDYALVIRDANSVLVASIPSSTLTGGVVYQPLDADLTAIAALVTSAYGRALLTLANPAALQAAAGIGTAGILDEATIAEYRSNAANKVLTTDQVWGAAASVGWLFSGTITLDFAAAINFTMQLTGNTTFANPVNGKPGQTGRVEIVQDATGSRTANFGSNWKFAGGIDPVLSTAGNTLDILRYEVLADGTVLASLTKGVA